MLSINDMMGIAPELRRYISERISEILSDQGVINQTVTNDINTIETEAAILNKAASGDLVLVVTPATLGSSAADVTAAIAGAEGKFTRDVTVELKTAAGEVHNWFNGTFAIAGSETTAGDGTADTSDTTVALVNGVGTCTLEYIGAWAEGDTATVTVTGGTKLGYSVTNKTSVDTLVA